MRAVPQNPTPPELERYYAQVQEDKNKGSLMAPFTRGESSRVTATEAVALASYTASEIGRMARERDAMIEQLADVYLSILATFLEEEPTNLVQIDGKIVSISPEDLRGDFVIFASDQASTPLSDVAAKNQLLMNIPTLEPSRRLCITSRPKHKRTTSSPSTTTTSSRWSSGNRTAPLPGRSNSKCFNESSS
jgi:hypothetical protein